MGMGLMWELSIINWDVLGCNGEDRNWPMNMKSIDIYPLVN
jgi:hypothetical protein